MTATTLVFALPAPGAATTADIEQRLVGEARAGDEPAFERLYRRHVARVHTLACRMASAEAADDLTQDIFIRAWDKLPTFRGESSFATWLHRLAVNVILGQRRGERGERLWITDEPDAIALHPGREAPAGLRLDLEAAIARLPGGARRVFVLHDIEGWTHEEIADHLGLAIGTSKSQLSRARATLRGAPDAR